MHAEPTSSDKQTPNAAAHVVTECPNCRAQMPGELRFCRACGFRLGEGVAEFTETVRFENAQTGGAARERATSAAPRVQTAEPRGANVGGNLNDWGAVARGVGQTAAQNGTQQLEGKSNKNHCSTSSTNWKTWLLVIVIIMVVSGGVWKLPGLRNLRDNLRATGSASSTGAKVGVDAFETADNGVTFDKVTPAGGPADKAGLVGGDVVTTFDGQSVTSARQLRDLLAATPVGKTVDVVYIRDGETKMTKLTPISKAEMERLEEAAGNRTRGFVGIGNDYEEIAVPGTNMRGVQLTGVRRNNPAYIAGIRDGDIVIEFDGVPIRTYEELESRTRRAAPDSTVKVVVMRGSERLEIPVKVGVDD